MTSILNEDIAVELPAEKKKRYTVREDSIYTTYYEVEAATKEEAEETYYELGKEVARTDGDVELVEAELMEEVS